METFAESRLASIDRALRENSLPVEQQEDLELEGARLTEHIADGPAQAPAEVAAAPPRVDKPPPRATRVVINAEEMATWRGRPVATKGERTDRDLSLTRDVPRVMAECGLLVGGIILILGMALGFTNYLVDAQIPDLAAEWVRATITSPWVFLLALNLLLLLVGAFMDIFSAIIVVTPLIVPIGIAFGIEPVHLGIIFLANMELGFLTPPLGMNLSRMTAPVASLLPQTACTSSTFIRLSELYSPLASSLSQ